MSLRWLCRSPQRMVQSFLKYTAGRGGRRPRPKRPMFRNSSLTEVDVVVAAGDRFMVFSAASCLIRSSAFLAIGEPVAAWGSKNLRRTCAEQPLDNLSAGEQVVESDIIFGGGDAAEVISDASTDADVLPELHPRGVIERAVGVRRNDTGRDALRSRKHPVAHRCCQVAAKATVSVNRGSNTGARHRHQAEIGHRPPRIGEAAKVADLGHHGDRHH